MARKVTATTPKKVTVKMWSNKISKKSNKKNEPKKVAEIKGNKKSNMPQISKVFKKLDNLKLQIKSEFNRIKQQASKDKIRFLRNQLK
jgi:hypothetical protein